MAAAAGAQQQQTHLQCSGTQTAGLVLYQAVEAYIVAVQVIVSCQMLLICADSETCEAQMQCQQRMTGITVTIGPHRSIHFYWAKCVSHAKCLIKLSLAAQPHPSTYRPYAVVLLCRAIVCCLNTEKGFACILLITSKVHYPGLQCP
jgi:hypothetical protein